LTLSVIGRETCVLGLNNFIPRFEPAMILMALMIPKRPPPGEKKQASSNAAAIPEGIERNRNPLLLSCITTTDRIKIMGDVHHVGSIMREKKCRSEKNFRQRKGGVCASQKGLR
jgi:hypothetical protein